MCGIFGVITKPESDYSNKFLKKSLTTLAKLSQSRGKDSSGLCSLNNFDNSFHIVKGPIPADELLTRTKVKKDISRVLSKNNNSNLKLIFGHARLVTNGTQLDDINNQPVIKDDIICIHNGIVVNVDDLWNNHKKINREYEIDTEVIPALVRKELNKGKTVTSSVVDSFKKIIGTASIAMTFSDINKFVLATNNGSLYILHNDKDIIYFASERAMLNSLAKKLCLKNMIGSFQLFQLKANNIFTIDLNDFTFNNSSFLDVSANSNARDIFLNEKKEVKLFSEKSKKKQLNTVLDLNQIHLNSDAEKDKKLLIYPIDKIKTLKRCTKCILPETFPYIEFDKLGECNYCKNHKKKSQKKSLEELKLLVEPYRNNNGLPDCFVPLSGGRDSTYVLHFLKKELGLNVITFTYDWGMVTDLARRNIARICGKLGVENIIVAADIHWKRENIRKNITAWLNKPELGMIPLFMSGDKFFFYYAHKIKKQLGIDLEIWGVNDLENTNFKTGFAGLKPQFDKKRIYSISLYNQIKLFGFVAKNLLQSPGYFNQSILDSLGSYASRYITPKTNYFHMFDYTHWDEKHIENLIINNYNWETCVDTKSTWRIGDGTASFYNYVYTLVAGFSENDTFRSNQIREGMISREQALKLVYKENQPRYNSLKWYLEIIGLDFGSTIEKINTIPRNF